MGSHQFTFLLPTTQRVQVSNPVVSYLLTGGHNVFFWGWGRGRGFKEAGPQKEAVSAQLLWLQKDECISHFLRTTFSYLNACLRLGLPDNDILDPRWLIEAVPHKFPRQTETPMKQTPAVYMAIYLPLISGCVIVSRQGKLCLFLMVSSHVTIIIAA